MGCCCSLSKGAGTTFGQSRSMTSTTTGLAFRAITLQSRAAKTNDLERFSESIQHHIQQHQLTNDPTELVLLHTACDRFAQTCKFQVNHRVYLREPGDESLRGVQGTVQGVFFGLVPPPPTPPPKPKVSPWEKFGEEPTYQSQNETEPTDQAQKEAEPTAQSQNQDQNPKEPGNIYYVCFTDGRSVLVEEDGLSKDKSEVGKQPANLVGALQEVDVDSECNTEGNHSERDEFESLMEFHEVEDEEEIMPHHLPSPVGKSRAQQEVANSQELGCATQTISVSEHLSYLLKPVALDPTTASWTPDMSEQLVRRLPPGHCGLDADVHSVLYRHKPADTEWWT